MHAKQVQQSAFQRLAIVSLPMIISMFINAVAAAATPTDAPSVRFIYVDNRITIQCLLDGQGPFTMVVDTGDSGITLTPETARRLHLAVSEAGTTSGAGNKSVEAGAATLGRLSIGGLSLRDLGATVIDLSEIRTKLHFPRLDGIVGYAVLKQFATLVNVDAGTLTFYRTAPSVPADATTTRFTGVIPEIFARVDGIVTRVLVDAGDRSSLTLFGPFAKAHKFFGRYPSRSNIITGYGLGGPVYADVFTIRSLDVFGSHLGEVVTRASRQTAGVFNTAAFGGSVGTGVLRRFNIIYDYPNHRIIAWPSKYFGVADAFVPPGR